MLQRRVGRHQDRPHRRHQQRLDPSVQLVELRCGRAVEADDDGVFEGAVAGGLDLHLDRARCGQLRVALEPGLHGAGERVLGDVGLREQVARGRQLAEHQLEPQLVDLVDHDEAHLVVGQVALARVEAALQLQQLLDLDVVPVAGLLWHPETVARPARRPYVPGGLPAR